MTPPNPTVPPPPAPTDQPDPAATPSDQPDTAESEAYEIVLGVHTDGTFTVRKQTADDGEGELGEGRNGDVLKPAGDADEGAQYTEIGAALKGILNVYKENPVGSDAQAQFEAGYGGPSETPQGKTGF